MRRLLLLSAALSVMFMFTSVSIADDAATVKGYVSDSICGANGANEKAAQCTKKCIQTGAHMVVVTDGDQKVLTVQNPDALSGHEGHHVAVTGKVNGSSIHVDTVSML